MAFYMFQGAYTPEAWATMTKNPQDRSVVLAELIQKLGGRLISFYYCFEPGGDRLTSVLVAVLSSGHEHSLRVGSRGSGTLTEDGAGLPDTQASATEGDL